MSFIKKEVVAKAPREAKERAERKAIEFSLTKLKRGGVLRDMFDFSTKKFDELGLTNHSIVFTDSPLALVLVKEDSDLATALFSKREGKKEKSKTFALPELVKVLEESNVIPTTREEGFKANFKLTQLDSNSAEFVAIQADAESLSDEVVAAYKIDLEEITKMRTRVLKAEVSEGSTEPTLEDGDELPLGALQPAGEEDEDSLDNLDDDDRS